MVNAAEAREIITRSIKSPPVEECSLIECRGRVLAADVIAPHDVPLFDNSSMDGYAVLSSDILSAGPASPAHLKLWEEIPAGRVAVEKLRSGYAARIMTGAPVPNGADAVVEQEMTESRNGDVHVLSPVNPGRNIRRRGEDIRQGSVVLNKGVKLAPAAIGVLASLGIAKISLHRRPKVAFMTTGNEVVEVAAKPRPGQIRNSNRFTLEGLIRESDCEPVNLGIIPDLADRLTTGLRKALTHDAVVTSGGVSVGKYDLVLDVMKAEGVDIRFWKVNIKPGMPMAFGLWNSEERNPVPVFALPGNPVSSMVTFLQFVRPGLEKLCGMEQREPLRINAILGEDFRKGDGKRHFVRGVARNDANGIVVTSTGSQSSGVLTSMANANCFIIIPESVWELKKGDSVEIELL